MQAITLDQLEVFRACAEEGTFSGAARRLGRAQSAVSHAIANLEAQLDVQLFDRSSRRPRVTAAGRALLVDATGVGEQVGRLLARAGSLARGIEPEISLSVDAMFETRALLDALSAFRGMFPTVTLRLQTEGLGGVVDSVASGACQLGITGPLDEFPSSLSVSQLRSVTLVPVVAASHPLARHRGTISSELLRDEVQIVLTDRTQRTAGVDRGVLSGHTWRVAEIGTKLALIEAGVGWGSLPVHMIHGRLRRGSLARIYPAAWDPEGLDVSLHTVYRVDAPPGPAGRWLLDRLR